MRAAVVALLLAGVATVGLLQIDWGREKVSNKRWYMTALNNITSQRGTVGYNHTISVNNSSPTDLVVNMRPTTKHETSTKEGPIPGKSTSGYVLAVDYWEQQTSGSRNLQNLQCWAALYNLSVVEPALSRSQLRLPLNYHMDNKRLWFRDLYDIEEWNRLSSEFNHSQLVSWDNFLTSAPRDAILVTVKHAATRKHWVELPRVRLPPSQRAKEGCASNWKSVKQFLIRHHFHVSREVCFNFAFGDSLSRDEFESRLFGSLSPSSSTVIFSQWRGTGPPSRVAIHDTRCGNTHIQERAGPSQHLLHLVQQYQSKYLGGVPYMAVIARTEKVMAVVRGKKGKVTLAQCFSHLLREWRETRAHSGLNSTLLAIDMGRFGSNSIHNAGEGTELSFRFRELFKSLYGSSMSVEDWEDSFEDTAHTKEPGYVAALQQMLVVQAKCVVFIGGGSFQKHTYTLYKNTHHKHKCVRDISECS